MIVFYRTILEQTFQPNNITVSVNVEGDIKISIFYLVNIDEQNFGPSFMHNCTNHSFHVLRNTLKSVCLFVFLFVC